VHAWVKKLIYGNTESTELHSSWDPDLKADSVDGLISHLTSNAAFNRYGFRRCGRDD
jgi:hypothetical protein